MSDYLPNATKDSLRTAALARRGALEPAARIEASLCVAERVEQLGLPVGAMVAGFWPIRDEIDPRPLMAGLRERGHGLCLPVVAEPHLIFRELLRGAELVAAGFGTVAPGPGAAEVVPDVLLVPLAAFDRTGHRIGYGKGHYDRAIAAIGANRPLRLIGVAFAVQEVETVPFEDHDRPLDAIVTETELIRCRA
ncbi:5-formyltetrahydrofolate cyclo-ligase [Breoghania corrubedonensis]|uniref:5-formyltetrahydrofolate cyclo-ligase n=1 Tax=Breoghania corrubedonensis TaxID=665038 RepID=A0A2T5V7C9_9HYPH|nr:5-formyltetrahydrofolate cyclo-ligase [Breoghania corrubedonensis]PTW59665.1 5-formyltetrahydrofolate cyclo-ligase [Breoghania corrubedonensis]